MICVVVGVVDVVLHGFGGMLELDGLEPVCRTRVEDRRPGTFLKISPQTSIDQIVDRGGNRANMSRQWYTPRAPLLH